GADAPAVPLDGVKETLDGGIEGCRLLEVDGVASLWQHHQTTAGDGTLEEQGDVECGVVFVAGDDKHRRRDGGKLALALKQRCTPTLHPDHGARVTRGRAFRKLALELGPAARVFVPVLDARGTDAVELGHGRHALTLDSLGERCALLLEPALCGGISGGTA